MRASLGLTVVAVALVGGSLSGCSSLNTGMTSALEPETACAVQAAGTDPLAPEQAALLVHTNKGECQPGTFAMTVRSVGRAGSVLYLNSTYSVYDAHNLSVAVLAKAQEQLAAQDGDRIENLIGRRIVVQGVARRVGTDLWSPGVVVEHLSVDPGATRDLYPAPRPSIVQLSMSHVLVKDANQIRLAQTD